MSVRDTKGERFLLGHYGSIISVTQEPGIAYDGESRVYYDLGKRISSRGEIKYNYRWTYRRTGNDGNNTIAGDSYVKSNNDNTVAANNRGG